MTDHFSSIVAVWSENRLTGFTNDLRGEVLGPERRIRAVSSSLDMIPGPGWTGKRNGGSNDRNLGDAVQQASGIENAGLE
ncbi:hypothetical protein VKS41_008853 [Umbelopsis sp. WA50703]